MLLVCTLSGASLFAQDTTYYFSGTCTRDCTGTATGTLVLRNYTPGTSLTLAHFVSFTFISSNQGTSTFDSVSSLSGRIPVTLPARANVYIEGDGGLGTDVDGTWNFQGRSSGEPHTWSRGAAPPPPGPAGAPTLSDAAFVGLAAALAVMGAWFMKKKAACS